MASWSPHTSGKEIRNNCTFNVLLKEDQQDWANSRSGLKTLKGKKAYELFSWWCFVLGEIMKEKEQSFLVPRGVNGMNKDQSL
jgi:hypothetical protein